MKFSLTFKTPDVLDQLCEDIEDGIVLASCIHTAKKFIQYGECVTLEFDTETQSVIVKE